MATNIKYQGLTVQVTAGGTYVSGTPVKIGTALFGIPVASAASGAECAVMVTGVADLPKSGGTGVTFSLGDKVYWSGTAATATATDSLVGVATAAALNAATTVEVSLNGSIISQADADALAAAFGGSATAIGFGKILGASTIGIHRCNFAGTTAPGATNDLDEGYHAGSLWFDTTGGRVYYAISVADGAAVWASIPQTKTGTVAIASGASTGTVSVGTAFNGLPVLLTLQTAAGAIAAADAYFTAAVAAGTLTATCRVLAATTQNASSDLVLAYSITIQ